MNCFLLENRVVSVWFVNMFLLREIYILILMKGLIKIYIVKLFLGVIVCMELFNFKIKFLILVLFWVRFF